MRRLALAALLLAPLPLAPRAVRAQGPAGIDLPAGYFSYVYHAWTLADDTPGCAAGGAIAPAQPCFVGYAAWGQRAGTTDALGLTLLVGLRASSVPTTPYFHLYGTGGPYGEVLAGGRWDGFEAAGGDIAAPGFSVVRGGHFPEFYLEGAPPFAFDLTRVGAEYYYADANGSETNDVFLTPTVTPEPATLALTLGGLAVLGAGAWRRRA